MACLLYLGQYIWTRARYAAPRFIIRCKMYWPQEFKKQSASNWTHYKLKINHEQTWCNTRNFFFWLNNKFASKIPKLQRKEMRPRPQRKQSQCDEATHCVCVRAGGGAGRTGETFLVHRKIALFVLFHFFFVCSQFPQPLRVQKVLCRHNHQHQGGGKLFQFLN